MIRFDGDAYVRSLMQASDEVARVADSALEAGVAFAVLDAQTTPAFQDRTGALRSSIRRADENGKIQVEADGGHALFVEEDTREHAIVARNAKSLRFVVNGAVVFRKSVQHPGTTGKHFMQHARDAAEDETIRLVEIGLSRVFVR